MQPQPSQKPQRNIVGWGADLGLKRRPGYPRELNLETVLTNEAEPIRHRQIRHVKVHKTPERDKITPVFGTSCPPKGLSGLLRDWAFVYSEDRMRHWVLLIFADRVDMVEGWISDLLHGRMPMILPRLELRSLDHLRRILAQGPKGPADRRFLATFGLVTAGTGLGAVYWMSKRGKRKGKSRAR